MHPQIAHLLSSDFDSSFCMTWELVGLKKLVIMHGVEFMVKLAQVSKNVWVLQVNARAVVPRRDGLSVYASNNAMQRRNKLKGS